MAKVRMTDKEVKAMDIPKSGGRITGKPARAQKRKDPDEMSVTEKRFAMLLQEELACGRIDRWDFEPERLVLAKNTAYKPDFRVVASDGEIIMYEVKPRNWRNVPNQEASNVKIKIAAGLHPYKFIRVFEQKDGAWDYEIIDPR